ncbi:MAG: KH domain-containing protein [Candidatus Levybacteria bacterium]|nr:KH domain-containing protein [Candidatus Levybacteria bacterium]
MDKKEIKVIKTVADELFGLLNIDGKFDILENKSSTDSVLDKESESVDIILDTKDTGIVIGYHGDTMEGLQLVLSLCIAKKLGRFIRVSLEVGDYKKNRIEWLKSLAQETKERVLSENKEIIIPEMKSWERRVIHLELQDDKEVISESQGEGRDRVLVVKPR